jgi:hypothetical protein
MKMPWSKFKGLPKLLVICVTVLLVASTLCGLQSSLAVVFNHFGIAPEWLIVLDVAELIAIVLSAAGAVLVVILWVVRTFYSRTSGE